MGTVAVRVVCVGGGRSMPSFYLFSFYIYGFFLSRYRPVFSLPASFNALSVFAHEALQDILDVTDNNMYLMDR